MRLLLLTTLLLNPKNLLSQEITQNDLKYIDSALGLIRDIGDPYSSYLDSFVVRIETWGGGYSSAYSDLGKKGTIYLSEADVKSHNINNIAAAIVHESLHLKYFYYGIHPCDEEKLCYYFEYTFLIKIPNVEYWLLEHTVNNYRFWD
jgi:hypothetical protein